MVVILGTAHGSNTPGKCSPDKKFREYKWSREICRMVKEALLLEGIESYIDIEGETEKSLKDRVHIVNSIVKAIKPKDCIYVSIHVNAAPKPTWSNATGCTVFVYNKASEKSKKLALHYYDICKEKKLLGNRSIPATKYFSANFAVLRDTSCPAILTENEFMTTKESVEWLQSEEGKKTICDLHVETIKRYINDNGQ